MTQHSTPTAGPLSPAAFAGAESQLGAVLTQRLADVETFLDTAVAQTEALPDETCHHLLRAGGKRVRPMLVLLAAEYGDPARAEVIKAAAAVELIHLATLYHDDVMDDAPVRRGARAAHEVWGNSVAILTGDLLFARASLLSSELGPAAVQLQAQAFERLVLGQLNEFTGPQAGDDPIAHYLQVLADKTGSLIAGSCEFGLLAGQAPAAYVPVLREYGERIGVAFQLADDIIDLTSPAETSGKTPGTDLREGVPTMPVLLAHRAAAAGDAEAAGILQLLAGDLSSDDALEEARAALAAHPVTAEARQEARSWADAAQQALTGLPEGWVRTSLHEFADTVVSRAC